MSAYTPSGGPSTRSPLSSAQIRAEFAAVSSAFAKLPDATGGVLSGGGWNNANIFNSVVTGSTLGSTGSPCIASLGVISFDVEGADYTSITGGRTCGIGRHSSYVGGFTLFTSPSAGVKTTRMTLDGDGNIIISDLTAVLATDATNGFVYLPTCAGDPTGTPALASGSAFAVPVIINATDKKIAVNIAGTWYQTAALT